MTPPTLLRWSLRGGTAALAALALAASPAAVTSAQAAASAPATPTSRSPAATNPYSPLYGHPYRQGVVPTISALQQMIGWTAQHATSLAPLSLTNLSYGGGIHRIGVTTGHEKVYLVVYGSQWGSKGRNSRGDVTLSKDPSGEVPRLQEFFKGLGTNSEKWSGVMTQYCQGVAKGAQSCPASNTHHVAYPSGGALAGVWVDERRSSPSQATGHLLGTVARAAAAHFGNTTAARNRDAQYVVLSPHGTHPDGFNTSSGQFCAWHDWNGDTTLSGGAVSSPYGDIAFTNDPYVTDAGSSCGSHFVNSTRAGANDGITIVEGHEYAETITDQNPSGGWTDWMGYENGDKCAWISPGSSGGAFNLTLRTGTYAMQTTWANDGASGAGACEGRHAIVHNG
jgi:serine protease